MGRMVMIYADDGDGDGDGGGDDSAREFLTMVPQQELFSHIAHIWKNSHWNDGNSTVNDDASRKMTHFLINQVQLEPVGHDLTFYIYNWYTEGV